jgi:octaprenyl-diphosphate synthase
MVLLSAKACHYDGERHLDLAAAVEYFHNATLLHDDVVDGSTLRRGKQTANEIWDSKSCILIGDFLFTQSFQWVLNSRDLALVDLFAHMATNIARGEVKQLSLKNQGNTTFEDYLDIIRSKTSLLFSVSAESGARLAQMSPEICSELGHYGLHLGNAFQMIDDALDYSSKAEVIGKNIGDDLADGKMTLPLICAANRATPEQAAMIRSTIQAGNVDNLPLIINIIQETNAIDYTYELAQNEIDLAIKGLNGLKNSPYKEGLIQLANFAVAREF